MKQCYGNFMLDLCYKNGGHHNCEHQLTCFGDTNEKQGECDCQFKRSCHTSRQYLQNIFRQENKDYNLNNCWFYEYFIKRHNNKGE